MTMSSLIDIMSTLSRASALGCEVMGCLKESEQSQMQGTTLKINSLSQGLIIALGAAGLCTKDSTQKAKLAFFETACRFIKIGNKCKAIHHTEIDDAPAHIRLSVAAETAAFVRGGFEALTYSALGSRIDHPFLCSWIHSYLIHNEIVLRHAQIRMPSQTTGHDNPAELPRHSPDGLFDLLNFDTIPEELHTDPILSQYVDCITLAPIRYAACFRGQRQRIYEKAVILDYIQRKIDQGMAPTCPISRDPISFADIVDDEATQRIIDNRLNRLSSRLQNQLQALIQQELEAL